MSATTSAATAIAATAIIVLVFADDNVRVGADDNVRVGIFLLVEYSQEFMRKMLNC
jgi:hypothetical protein